MSIEFSSYKDARPTEEDILRREATKDPKLHQYMIEKGLVELLREPPTAEEIAATQQKEAAYLAAKGIVPAQ